MDQEFEQTIAETIPSKNISYLRARDPSILAYGHAISTGKARNLFAESTSSTISENAQEEDDSHLHVYLRMKNCENYQHLYEISDNNKTLVCKVPMGAQCIRNIRDGATVTKLFKFSKIFGPNAGQIDLFNDVVKGKVLHFINGSNCSLLTYGASGSGKTYTIVGTTSEPGIVPRALEYLFRTLPPLPEEPRIKPDPSGGIIRLHNAVKKTEKNASHILLNDPTFNADREQHIRTYRAMQHRLSNEPVAVIDDNISDVSLSVWVSFAEIYNESIYDLLKPEPPRGHLRQKLRLGQCRNNAYIKDLTCINVTSGLEAYQILQYGLHNLKYAATSINDHSSRSHSIFTIRLVQANTKEGYTVSSFNFCDLAGSERLKKTLNVGDRLKESNNINTSLLVLGRCITLIRNNQKQSSSNVPIPFRDSKLTQLFQRALSGQELISMVVNINPIREMFDESQHTLNFSAIAKDVTIEQQRLIQNPPRQNRFSQYLASRKTVVISTVVEEQEEQDDLVEELQVQVTELMLELEQQKIDAKEDREYVMSTYKELLRKTNEYWENRCQELEKRIRNNKPVMIQRSNKDVSVIDLDSTNSDSSFEEAKSSRDEFIAAQNEIIELKRKLQEKDETIKNLSTDKNSLQHTLDDAVKAYQQLEKQFESKIKEMQVDIIWKDDQLSLLQTHNHTYPNFTNYADEDKENTIATFNVLRENNKK